MRGLGAQAFFWGEGFRATRWTCGVFRLCVAVAATLPLSSSAWLEEGEEFGPLFEMTIAEEMGGDPVAACGAHAFRDRCVVQ